MEQVVADPTIKQLADTPDKAVVWGFALGLHDEVAEVLRRGLEDSSTDRGTAGQAYYPVWLGSSPSSFGSASLGGAEMASGGIFSGSGAPDIGAMPDFVRARYLQLPAIDPREAICSSGGPIMPRGPCTPGML